MKKLKNLWMSIVDKHNARVRATGGKVLWKYTTIFEPLKWGATVLFCCLIFSLFDKDLSISITESITCFFVGVFGYSLGYFLQWIIYLIVARIKIRNN